VGFVIPIGQEYIWNWCPTCAGGLELDVRDLEIEYDTAKEDSEDSLYDV
jgi:hypothetical protein